LKIYKKISKNLILTIMPNLNHTGPEGKGLKTGRKLGTCKKTEADLLQSGTFGKGLGKRRHAGGGIGKGKRLKYI
jgi:hypothetical protein